VLVLKRHPLVKADLQAAFDWYEDKRPGLRGSAGVSPANFGVPPKFLLPLRTGFPPSNYANQLECKTGNVHALSEVASRHQPFSRVTSGLDVP